MANSLHSDSYFLPHVFLGQGYGIESFGFSSRKNCFAIYCTESLNCRGKTSTLNLYPEVRLPWYRAYQSI